MDKLKIKEVQAKNLTIDHKLVVDTKQYVYYRNNDDTVEKNNQLEVVDILGLHKYGTDAVIVVLEDGRRKRFFKEEMVLTIGYIEKDSKSASTNKKVIRG